MKVGTSVGPFRVVRHLGAGGMGSVWLAEDPRLRRHVALKTLRNAEQADERGRDGLLREARAVAALSHPHIATLFDVLDLDGDIVLVFEYVEGETLSARLETGPLPPETAIGIGRQLAEALAAAHARGVIHRDLKPSNVIVREGQVKVLDFGVARLRSAATTTTGATTETTAHAGFVGTPAYAAPEQMLSGSVDERADLYALGVILYEMVSGRRPFEADDFVALAESKLHHGPRPLSSLVPAVPRGLELLVSGLLSKYPESRPRSAADVVDALAALGEEHGHSRPLLTRARALIGAALAAVLVGVVAMLGWPARSTPTPPASPPVVAVLPFANASGDASRNFMAEGLSDSLIASLAAVRQLTVLSRATISEARTRFTLPADIARDVGATMLVEGTLQQVGDQIKVSATLVRPDGTIAWADTIESRFDRIFEVQSRLAGALSAALAVPLTAEQRARIDRVPTSNAQALAAYWRGRTLVEQVGEAGRLEAAIDSYREAIRLDSGFALAYAALGDAYRLQYLETRDPQLVKQAVDAGTEALRIDAERPEVRYTLATTLFIEGRLKEAEDELHRALNLQPNYDDARRELGRVLARQGRIDEAVSEFRLAINLRPNAWTSHSVMGLALLNAQRYDEAADAFRRVTELQPNNYIGYQQLGIAYQSLGRDELALENYQKANAIRPSAQAYSNIGVLQHARGEFALAVTAYEQAIKLRPNSAATHRNLGDALARLGRAKEAQTAYRQAVALARADLKVNPTDARVMAALAVYLQKSGDAVNARQQIAQALEGSGSDNEVLFRAAVVSALSKRGSEALSYLERAIAGGYSRSVAAEAEEFGDLRSTTRFKELTRAN